MKAHVNLGESLNFFLKDALLIYKRDRGNLSSNDADVFLTQHPVTVDGKGVPSLGTANLVDRSFLRSLLMDLQGTLPVEILPENVLARTVESICWWVPAAKRVMYYMADRSPELSALSGGMFPQPALLFEASAGNLRIRALAEDKRPDAKTKLFRAPYWNVSDVGVVCLGSTRAPKEAGVASIARWEASFFESEFTHANAVHRLTEHPLGFAGLWTELKGAPAFPSQHLSSANQTLEQFLRA